MSYLIGTDEAGYGPNLGPLLVAATVWETPDGLTCGDLMQRLSGVVAADAVQAAGSPPRVWMGDSKRLYQSGKGLRHLERGVWAALAALGHAPHRWREMWQCLAPGACDVHQADPCYGGFDMPLPLDVPRADLAPLAAAFVQGLAEAGVRLAAIRARAVFPGQFNALVGQHGTKGEALSQITLGLAAELIEPLPDAPIFVVCDKHGGRNQYQRLLASHFPDSLVEVHGEGRASSVYRFGPSRRRVEFRFEVGAECNLPTALASMVAKYLRELAMRAWNDFWCRRVEGLQPTAGYPQDAGRFKRAIAAAQRELGIADAAIWRAR